MGLLLAPKASRACETRGVLIAMEAPVYVVFAGVNGVGKSTLYQSCEAFMPAAEIPKFRVNPDEILAQAGKDWASQADQLWAGKQAVKQVNDCFTIRRSFNQETTLAGKSALHRIKRAKSLGYFVRLFYIGVDSPEKALERIANRVQIGGHDIDPAVVKRRFEDSFNNFARALDFTHEAFAIDNTNGFVPLAVWTDGTLSWASPSQASEHSWLLERTHQPNWRS